MTSHRASGTLALVRHALRRDRIFWPAWLGMLSIQLIATVASYQKLYPTEAGRAALLTTIGSNRSLIALYGPAFDLSTSGGFTAWRIYGFALIMAGLMSIMAVVRHTRAEEEVGRLELLRAGVVSRHSPLLATMLLTLAANAVLGLATFGALRSDGQALAGSANMGLGFFLVGAVFTGVAAVAVQIPENARPARGLALAVLALAFVLRALGDSSSTAPWLSWLSPIGWAQQSRPFAGERWWTLVIPLCVAVVLVAAAFVLETRRDFASGLRPTKLGPPVGGPRLAGASGLAWRLQRGSWAAWIIGIAFFAAVLGAVANGVLDIFRGNAQLERMFREMGGSEGDLIDTFFAAVLPLIGMIACVHAITVILRVRSEETELRAEQVLATATTRTGLLASHAVHAIASPFVLMTVAGASAGAAYGLSVHNASQIGRLTASAMASVPAMLLVVGFCVALLGLLPQNTAVIWGGLGYFVLIGQIGPLLKLPSWVLRTSPFGNVPSVPGAHVAATPLVVMSVLAIALLGVGFMGFRHRDIA